jgi:hypothetical protein
LHKTGTTSVQAFLHGATDELRRHGILYPCAGVPEPHHGHHNIAWQLARDRRFRRSSGTIDDLVQEISQFGGDAIVSSEDFESVLDMPERFAPVFEHPVLRNYDIVLMFYVRNQISYLESLFLQLLGSGIGEEFAVFVEPVLRERRLRIQEWVFQFDYAAIHARWASCPRAHVIVRSYHTLKGASVLSDFMDLACPALAPQAAAARLHANPRAPLADRLALFHQIRMQRPLAPGEAEAIQSLCEAIGDRPVIVSSALRQRLSAIFRTSNRTLCAASGVAPEGLADIDTDCRRAVALDSLFSFEVQNLIADVAAGHVTGPGSWESVSDRLRAT